ASVADAPCLFFSTCVRPTSTERVCSSDSCSSELAQLAGALPVLYTSVYGAAARPLPVSAKPVQLTVTWALPATGVTLPFVGAVWSRRIAYRKSTRLNSSHD